MSILKSAEECIALSKDALKHFAHVKDIIDESDFQKWTLVLDESHEYRNLFSASKFNLLNTSVLAGLAYRENLNDPISNHIRQVLSKTDLYLGAFKEMKSEASLKTKMKNLGGLNFLSTLSELSLAFQFKKSGFDVTFEKKFTQAISGAKRDVDLLIKDRDNEFNIEVYMPNQQLNVEGFFNPNQEDTAFSEKIGRKLERKFGLAGISGLTGKTLLSINKVFFDVIHIKSVLPFFNNDIVFADLARLLPKGVDGMIIFEDDFSGEKSFKLDKIVWKT